jgi:sec-independent protein translocase protein TatA
MSVPLAIIGMPFAWEWIVILIVFVMLFGVGKLPEVGKHLGKGIKNFKKEMRGAELDVTDTTEEIESPTSEEIESSTSEDAAV